jgi:hypothetical protein
MKKLISIVITFALCLCGAFFIPAYAEETEGFIIEEVATLPPIAEVEPPRETNAPAGGVETPTGAGTVIEDVSHGEVNRQFITVQSRGGNIFYIIIDNDRNGQNVYFLNAVDDFDLLSFSDNFPADVWEAYEELKESAANNAINAEISEGLENEENESESPDNPDEVTPANNTQLYILVGIGALFLVGLIYFKLIKGKKNSVKMPSYEDKDEEDDDESEEDLV